MSIFQSFRQDRTWTAGVILIIISLSFFCFVVGAGNTSGFLGIDGGPFLLNYLFVIIYFIVLISQGRLKAGRNGLAPLFLLLILLLISAYSLNRAMNVFERSTGWWVVLLVVSCVNYVALPLFEHLPTRWQQLSCGIMGISLAAFLYLAIYLTPLYIISVPGLLFLGISVHSFVPLLFVIYTLIAIRRITGEKRTLWTGFFAGIGLSLAVIVVFVARWNSLLRDMNRDYNRITDTRNADLPAWVYVAQRIPRGPIAEKVLKSGLVYSVYNAHWDSWGSMSRRGFGEDKRHDPLVVLATLLAGEPLLTTEERIKVLESLYDSRHQAQERLWKGDDLYTDHVSTQVEIWSRLHLSYTEKKITVVNRGDRSSWRNQQEAIYTFHLPEGAVISSLSLWINGREEKARLATRGKADSAYRTVVGVENRDPSVVHWQEGNRVSVRVFPVPAGERRQFTIGITAPLEKKDKELVYRNIYFDGPTPTGASEAISIHPEQPLSHLCLPSFFPDVPGGGHSIKREGTYQADWAIRFGDEGLDESSFAFNGKQYTLLPYTAERETADFREIYLDINKSWSRDEFSTIYQWIRNNKVRVYSPVSGLVDVNDNNKDALFRELSGQEFSLFPLPVVRDLSGALLISKSLPSSPTLADLGDCAFSGNLHRHFLRGEKIRCFNLGDELSPYIRTLKECGAFRFEQGSTDDLHVLLTRSQFARDMGSEGQVVIDEAGVMIRRSDEEGTGGGKEKEVPDHLLRLFTYHHILQKMGGRLPGEQPGDDPAPEEELVNEAREAGIVTPVSSLVVLETQNDYQRFNIEESKNSLKNAGLQGKGSVPEPGDWLLLIGVLFIFVYLRLQSIREGAKTGRL